MTITVGLIFSFICGILVVSSFDNWFTNWRAWAFMLLVAFSNSFGKIEITLW